MEDRSADASRDVVSEPTVPLDVLPLHSTSLLTVLDGEGIVQYESPSIERLYGYDQSELVGDQVAEYVHPDDRTRVVAAFRAVVASDDYIERGVEYRHRRADGTYLWVESLASANPTKEGHYVVNTLDISERKERERKLQDTNERLEEFANIVSHDLRNPLSVARGRLQLARNERDSEHLARVAEAHERIGDLIGELLTLARAGKRVSDAEPVALAELTRDCWRSVSTDDGTLVVEADRRLAADPGRLRQVLENLIRNAVEHGGADVRVTVGTTETGFYVEDDGPGIPEGKRAWVFEPGRSGTSDGTGLGLSIVEQIADAHGWEIALVDGSDGGARFEFSGVDFL